MRRHTFDVLASLVGLGLAVVLLVAGGLLTWAHNFVGDEVHNQLAAQKIYFPAANDPQLKDPAFAAVRPYAGQQLLTGQQAQVYADHYIANHLKAIGNGKTYSQLSGQAQKDPNNAQLQAQVATMFKGETLRGLLLNVYGWAKMGTLAGIAAIVAWVGAGIMLVLGGLGFWHSRRVPETREFLTRHHEDIEPSRV